MTLAETQPTQALEQFVPSEKENWESQAAGYEIVNVDFPKNSRGEPIYKEYEPESLREKMTIVSSEMLISQGIQILDYLAKYPRAAERVVLGLGDLKNKGRLFEDYSRLEFYRWKYKDKLRIDVRYFATSQYPETEYQAIGPTFKLFEITFQKVD